MSSTQSAIKFPFLVSLLLLQTALSQLITVQNNTWNASFSLSPDQTNGASLDDATVNNINVATSFERTNWATGSVRSDTFYLPPSNSSFLPPGSILKIEQHTNTSVYTLPPNTALSRILFQSETINGSSVPASAFVLWPWMPRRDERTGKYAVVGWAHGSFGVHDECGPSHIRNLLYQYAAPYMLALQGYVVVAPDYAGLGVGKFADGSDIRHPWLSNPSHANDLFHAVVAAQTAWPDSLSTNFVLMGHSQGGGAAWSAAQRQAMRPVAGYLGSIAVSPATRIDGLLVQLGNAAAFNFASGLATTLPGFDMAEVFTAKGLRQLELLREIGACNSGLSQFLTQQDVVKPGWTGSPWIPLFRNLTENGGRAIAGPMLVLQGTTDPLTLEQTTSTAVNDTCSMFPGSELEYVLLEGVTHGPALPASQTIWMDWIADRFAGRDAAAPCARKRLVPAREVSSYQAELNHYLVLANQAYTL